MVRLQPHASRYDGGHSAGVGPKGPPRGLSQKSSRAEKAPAKTREYHQGTSCLHGQIAQESQCQCSGTLTGLILETNGCLSHLTPPSLCTTEMLIGSGPSL